LITLGRVPRADNQWKSFTPGDMGRYRGFQNQSDSYQGSLYFNSVRANGFSFYESILCNALGSITWEMFCESTASSIKKIEKWELGKLSLAVFPFLEVIEKV
jgi:hypothetical protein